MKVPGTKLNNENLRLLIKYILEYWSCCLDWEQGGIFHIRDNFALASPKKEEKNLLMHVRQMYNYSVGSELKIPRSEEAAHHLFQSLDSCFPAQEGFYPSGKLWRWQKPSGFLSSYDQFYTVIGLSRYARSFKDKEAFAKAEKLFLHMRDYFCPGDFAGDGLFTLYDPAEQKFFYRSGNSHLHHLEALINLYLAGRECGTLSKQREQNYINIIEQSLQLFLGKLYFPDLKLMPDNFDDDFNLPPGQRYGALSLAHSLEWIGFWQEASFISGLDIPFLKEEALSVAQKTFERGVWENGCFCEKYYKSHDEVLPIAEFWSLSEAILNAALLSRLFNDSSYLNKARQLFAWHQENMFDPEYGGIFSLVRYTGLPLGRQKGGAWKCDHHALRMAEKILEYRILADD